MEKIFKKNNKKKIMIIVALVLVALIITFFCLYNFNYSFKQTVNNMITLKSKTNENVPMINIDQNNMNAIIAYDEYFAILKQNTLIGYTNAQEEFSVTVNVTNPVYYTEGKYLIIAQKGSDTVYLYKGKELVYEKTVGGTITGVSVNKNGYAAVTVTKSGYRSVITVYNEEGTDLFSTFLSTTYASHVVISPNNKNMAIVEVDTSGIQVASNIKFIQIDNVIQTGGQPINAQKEAGRIINNIQFSTNDTVVYSTDIMIKQVNVLKEKKDILNLLDTNIINADIGLGKYIVRTEKAKSNIFNTSTDVIITDTENKEVGRYNVEGAIKQLIVKDDIIATNIGQELYFVNVDGRPIKKYISNSDIKDVVIYNSGKMAALVYRNKVEIIYI